ncbi:MAG: 3-phosphoserine/phosphohydroxythreonine transaminase [Candidatus Thermoplasmatota archaeon]|nr:3-phosphoserine/phosphohydroxythreonine transaminase [Candidatus Thermoplasmatota archaeon]
MTKRVHNFFAGPATLPLPVLEKAREELLDFAGTGMSIMEISHRSKEYDKMHNEATALVGELMGLKADRKVLWLQGGASTQFYMVPANLQVPGKKMQYVLTGGWSKKAAKEARLYGEVEVVASSEDTNFSYIPKDVAFSEGAAFAHITGNNTLYGTEWHYMPKVPEDVPLVADLSSNFMDKWEDFNKYGAIYAGAQKNLGPAGVTIVIVREDLLGRVPDKTPTMVKWSTHAEKNSLYNTSPTFAIYICSLCLRHLKENGGINAVEAKNREKAKLIYDVIDSSDGFYKGHSHPDSRSLMNVTFRLPTEELEAKCVEEGKARGLIGLKGHRSVGGMRASIYNAMTIEGVKDLTEFMKEFHAKNQ